MSRDTLEVLEQRLQHVVARHEEVRGEREALAARLATMERAYAEVCQRLNRYERERMEIRSRLERILFCIDASGDHQALGDDDPRARDHDAKRRGVPRRVADRPRIA